MKSWKSFVVLIVVVLLASYYWLGTGLIKENRRNSSLITDIAGLTAVLHMTPGTTPDLDQRLSVAQAGLAAAENTFAGETDDTRIVNSILRMAEEAGVKVVPISTRPWSIEQISGRDYSVFNLTVSVAGDFQQVQSFIRQLENSEPPTLAVKYLKVDRVSADPGAGITADLDIAAYALPSAVLAVAVE
jgi:hypothetical protein